MEQTKNQEAPEFSPSKVNRHVIQSYIFSNAKSRFNIVQMRILYRLVEFAQCEIEGLLIKNNMCRIEHQLRHVDITLPITSVLPDGSKHYEQARAAIRAMMKEECEFYDTTTRTWHASPVVYNVSMADRKGVIEFSVADFVWDSLLDFTYGFRQFELMTVLNLHSVNSMRLYTLISGQKTPITYSFEKIREMFRLEDKYAQNSDIVKRIIKPAKQELDDSCPWSFDYRPMRQGRANVGITFFPYEVTKNRDQELYKKQLLSQVSAPLLAGSIYSYMRYNLDFMPKELNSNKSLLDELAHHVPDALDILASLKQRRFNADGSKKSKGWIIAALKSELENHKRHQNIK